MVLHGYSRTTGDMDIWVERNHDNYIKIVRAFQTFGMPTFDMNEENFLRHPNWEVFTFGMPPTAIDMMVSVKGMDFNNCFEQAIFFEEDGLMIRTIQLQDLVAAKRSAGRSKDINDLENLSDIRGN